jgi:acetyl-CoA carboxylase biotin carboxyl carrier protein
MDFKKVQDLLKYFESSKLTTLSVEEGDFKLHVSKLKEVVPVVPTTPVNEPKMLPPEVTPKHQTNSANKPTEDVLLKDVPSPLVGTFYAASSPNAEPFVKVGQQVNKGQTICIVEAMKIMNEITSPFTGVVEKINFRNGDVVGFNAVIVQIRPLG